MRILITTLLEFYSQHCWSFTRKIVVVFYVCMCCFVCTENVVVLYVLLAGLKEGYKEDVF